jgi:hypothetical protein
VGPQLRVLPRRQAAAATTDNAYRDLVEEEEAEEADAGGAAAAGATRAEPAGELLQGVESDDEDATPRRPKA